MKIRVLYFAQLAEQLGRDELTLEIDEEMTVGELLRHVQTDWPDTQLKSLPILKAVNEEYCDEFKTLSPGDCVAFLPPVAGG